MKSVSDLGLTTWGEFCLSLQRAGFEPQHIHQVINSKDNKLAKAMFEAFEIRGGEIVLRRMHQDRAGVVYSFDWKDGLECSEVLRILTFSDPTSTIEQLTEALIQKGMTYSQEELDNIIKLLESEKGYTSNGWKESTHALYESVASMFFVHNENKKEVSIIHLKGASSLEDGDKVTLIRLSLDFVLIDDGEVSGWDDGEEGGRSDVLIFVNAK